MTAVPIKVLGDTSRNAITALFTKGLEIQSSFIQCDFHTEVIQNITKVYVVDSQSTSEHQLSVELG